MAADSRRLPDRVAATLVAGEAALLERNVPMARFDKSSTKRPKQNAAVAASRGLKRSTAPSIEDTMFFPRLRRHAKWMFVFLAVALGGGFVIFGVGAGGTGVGDIFRGGGARAGVPSISSAQKKTEENPKDVAGVARPLHRPADRRADRQGDRRPERVVVLAPKDADALRELAGLYLAQATEKQRQAQILQLKAAYAGAGGRTSPAAHRRRPGQSLVDDKIGATLNSAERRRRSRRSIGGAERVGPGRRRLQEDRCAAAERPERPARARPGRRSRPGTRRRRSPPTRRS